MWIMFSYHVLRLLPCDFNDMLCWSHLLILWDVSMTLYVWMCVYDTVSHSNAYSGS